LAYFLSVLKAEDKGLKGALGGYRMYRKGELVFEGGRSMGFLKLEYRPR
jgi:hypothetical protein